MHREHHSSIDYNLLSKGLAVDQQLAQAARGSRDKQTTGQAEQPSAPYRNLKRYLGHARNALHLPSKQLSKSVVEDHFHDGEMQPRRPREAQRYNQDSKENVNANEANLGQRKKNPLRYAHHESLQQLLPEEESQQVRRKRNSSSNQELSALGGSANFGSLHNTMNTREKNADTRPSQKTQFMQKLFEKTLLRRTADMNIANMWVSSMGPRKEFMRKDHSQSAEPRPLSKGKKTGTNEEKRDTKKSLDSTDFLGRDGIPNTELRDKVRKLFNRTLLKTKQPETGLKSGSIHRSFQQTTNSMNPAAWMSSLFVTQHPPRSHKNSTKIPGLVNKSTKGIGEKSRIGLGSGVDLQRWKTGKVTGNGLEQKNTDPRSRSRNEAAKKLKRKVRKESNSKPSTKTGSKNSRSASSQKDGISGGIRSRLVTPPPARMGDQQNKPAIVVSEGVPGVKSNRKINNLSSGKKNKNAQPEERITPFRSSKNLKGMSSHKEERKSRNSSSNKKKSKRNSPSSAAGRLSKFYSRLCELVDSLDHNYNEENIKAISKMFLDYAKLVEEIDAEKSDLQKSQEEVSTRNKLLSFFAFFTKMNSRAYTHSKEMIAGALGVIEEFVVREQRLLKEYVPVYFQDAREQSLSLEQAVSMLVTFADKMIEVNNTLSAYIKNSIEYRESGQPDSKRRSADGQDHMGNSRSDREFEENTRIPKQSPLLPRDGDYRLVEGAFKKELKKIQPASPRILDYRNPEATPKHGPHLDQSDPRDHDFDDLEIPDSNSDTNYRNVEDTPVGRLKREFELVESKDSHNGGGPKSKEEPMFQINQDPKQTLSVETQKYTLGIPSLSKTGGIHQINMALTKDPPPVMLEKIYSLKKDSDFEYSETSKKKPLGGGSGGVSSSAHSTNQKSEVLFNLFSNTVNSSLQNKKEEFEHSASSKKDNHEGSRTGNKLVPELKLRLGKIQTEGDERMYFSGKEEDRKNPWLQHI